MCVGEGEGSVCVCARVRARNMMWPKGMRVEVGKEALRPHTFYGVLGKLPRVPERPVSAPTMLPISGVCKTKGSGDVWRAVWDRA